MPIIPFPLKIPSMKVYKAIVSIGATINTDQSLFIAE
jgi:hypothetical protein